MSHWASSYYCSVGALPPLHHLNLAVHQVEAVGRRLRLRRSELRSALAGVLLSKLLHNTGDLRMGCLIGASKARQLGRALRLAED